jgi:hypothetical protein
LDDGRDGVSKLVRSDLRTKEKRVAIDPNQTSVRNASQQGVGKNLRPSKALADVAALQPELVVPVNVQQKTEKCERHQQNLGKNRQTRTHLRFDGSELDVLRASVVVPFKLYPPLAHLHLEAEESRKRMWFSAARSLAGRMRKKNATYLQMRTRNQLF